MLHNLLGSFPDPVARYEVSAANFLPEDNTNYNRRPVNLLVMPDGSLLVTNNWASEIYRTWYTGNSDSSGTGGLVAAF